MTVGLDSVIVQEDEPVAAEVDGEVVMLSERAGAYFGLDGVGSEIWRLLAQPRRVSDLCQSLAQRYDADADTLIRDVTSFLDELLARKLVRLVERPAEKIQC
jgi:Coenzyme PQQ synthesis protein D (PqqD)